VRGSKGSVYKRCPCPADALRTERGRRINCPKKHGSWFIAYDEPSGDGKRRLRRQGGFPAEREARSALTDVLARLDRGTYTGPSRDTVATYLRTWLAGKANLRPTTRLSYGHHVSAYLVPTLGHHRLTGLRAHHIEAAYAEIVAGNVGRDREVGPTSLRRIHGTLSSALNAAVRHDLIGRNPAAHVELPAASAPRVQPWSAADLGTFLDSVDGDRLVALWHLLAFGGLRRGEGLGLTWSDVQLDRGIVTISRQVVQVGREVAVGKPKTKSGEDRRVDLDEGTAALLRAHRKSQAEDRLRFGAAWRDAEGRVFTAEDGGPLRPDYITRRFARLARSAGLRVVRLHDLRHGSASLQIAAGVPLVVISKRLGHSSTAVTSDVYGHLLEGVGRQAAEAAAALVPRRFSGDSAAAFPIRSQPAT
jgi:integrase